MEKTTEFISRNHTWSNMLQRCYNANRPEYKNYGGRGITVCEEWRTSYEQFKADMGLRPSYEHTLDRINNDGNYEPSNCRWLLRSEQPLNQRRPEPVMTHNGIYYRELRKTGKRLTVRETEAIRRGDE